MFKKCRSIIILSVLSSMFIAGCATTKINSVWTDVNYQGKPRKVMIIGMSKILANKRTLEDEFVKQIRLNGTNAIAGYSVLSEDNDSDKERVAAKMKELGADTVLITRITDRKTVYTDVRNRLYYPPTNYTSWRNYYDYSYVSSNSAGYSEEIKYAVIETNIYDADNDKLIWSASSETEISGTDQKFIKSYVGFIVDSLVKQKLLDQRP